MQTPSPRCAIASKPWGICEMAGGVMRDTSDVSASTDSAEPRPTGRVKLILAAGTFFPVYAGPAVRFTRYLPGFLDRGLDVEVFTGTPREVKARMSGVEPDWHGLPDGALLPPTTVHGVPVRRVKLPEKGGLRRSSMLMRRLLEACGDPAERPDVIQLLSLSWMSIPALLRLRRMRVPVVYTKTMLPDMPRNPGKRWILRRLIVAPLNLVSRVVVSSSVMYDDLRRLGVRTPIEVIPNGVDSRRFRPPASGESSDVRESLGISHEAPVIAFVGPVSPRKGVDLLLEAWCRLALERTDLQLLIVGPRRDAADPGHEAFHARLNHLVRASGAADRVHFTGLVEHVEEYMRAADIFVFTSRREGMPNVVPEAMATGLPVITTPFIGLPKEFGQEGREYIVADFDAEMLAATISGVLSDHDRRTRLGCSARRWVEEEMTVDRSLDRYAELYREVAKSANDGVHR